jgi:hypothetical protein
MGERLVDRLGREVLLRGINARVKGLFDVTFTTGGSRSSRSPPSARPTAASSPRIWG